MIAFALKILALVAVLVASVVSLWLSTPWGYKKSIYQRVVRPGSWIDDPQLLRALGLAGFLYGSIGGLWTIATGLEQLIKTGKL